VYQLRTRCNSPLLLLLLPTCRYYVLRHSLHPLKDVGLLCFRGEHETAKRQSWQQQQQDYLSQQQRIEQQPHPQLQPSNSRMWPAVLQGRAAAVGGTCWREQQRSREAAQ
jgi:hypothetical protein